MQIALPLNLTPLLELDRITIRLGGLLAFKNTSWRVRTGEHWAITGPNGSGKTVLVETIRGKFPLITGRIRYHFPDDPETDSGQTDHSPYRRISLVSFSLVSTLRHHPDMYYQQRFHATESQGMIPVMEWLEDQQVPDHPGEFRDYLLEFAGKLGITYLLGRQVNQLSNGETKKLLLLRAILSRPRMLILDQPFTGLDPEARTGLSELIDRIAASGIAIILAGITDTFPGCITHILGTDHLEVTGIQQIGDFQPAIRNSPPGHPDKQELLEGMKKGMDDLPFKYAVRMKDVGVRYQDVQILEGVNWCVKKGEHWALTGHNGSGKSTLLSLINADNPQAYAQNIWIFDRLKGSGETIWDIKEHIGFMSPEMHADIPGALSCRDVIAAGFQQSPGNAWGESSSWKGGEDPFIRLLDLGRFLDRSFDQVSSSEQRMVLLARALVKHPTLLILDEPCQGLDLYHQDKVSWLLDQLCTNTMLTLIYVSHHAEELPGCIDHELRLFQGKVVRGSFT
ncbi:MAG TPA: ATP-binding cassette domain-containing protein [Chitinophagaceae bacterium]|nr:ATP-binding cassette domain-containing protein [Chitinophagaceae bacterium]